MASVLVLCTVLSVWLPLVASAADPAWRVVELTNAERQRAGLAPLELNSQLTQAAQQYAQVLASSGCFSHQCGSTLGNRVAQVGYVNWTDVHENIAFGYATPEEVVSAWMASPSHRQGILDGALNEIGVGVASGGGQTYWVQVFGARPRPTTSYRFVLGFRTLADQIPGIVGVPLENERHNPENGDGLQRTSNGLLVWRKSDNWTAFTNGHYTWINGPYGLQRRLNTQRFLWEH